MRLLQQSISFCDFQTKLVDTLKLGEHLIFIDTNVLAWAYTLNDAAANEFIKWLESLADQKLLFIPSWVVHEYNHHLQNDTEQFFLPHRIIAKQLKSNLSEMQRIARLVASEGAVSRCGHGKRTQFFQKIADASEVIKNSLTDMAYLESERKARMHSYIADLVSKCALDSDIHLLSDAASQEAASRSKNRLAPGYKDGDKKENAVGDLIIWKEILTCCAAQGAKGAVLITNDAKPDWVYKPSQVLISGGRALSNSDPRANMAKLPKPDLVAEFKSRTGSKELHIFSVAAIIDALSSHVLNRSSAGFRHLALAIDVNLARTPTEAVIAWFLMNPDKEKEATSGVCFWERSPGEVNIDEFKAWVQANMKDVPDGVDWVEVFVDTFL